MIGYYVHHHGRGHLHRALAIVDRLDEDVMFLSSLPAPAGLRARDRWTRLPMDVDPAVAGRDVAANGRLHWAPIGVAGLATRAKMVLDVIAALWPRRFVVDVSVEITMLARLAGVPVSVVTMPDDRDDDAHQLAYAVADQIIAPWSELLYSPAWLVPHAGRCHFVGAISRFEHRTSAEGRNGGVLLVGAGGCDLPPDALERLKSAEPRRHWLAIGGGHEWVEDVWPHLSAAEVVVTHGGQGALADIALAEAAAVVIPQDRPFGEQRATADALERAEIAVVAPSWPSPDEWPALLAKAAGMERSRWKLMEAQGASSRAAAVLAA